MDFFVISNRYNFGPTSIVFHSPNLQIGHREDHKGEVLRQSIYLSLQQIMYINYKKQKRII